MHESHAKGKGFAVLGPEALSRYFHFSRQGLLSSLGFDFNKEPFEIPAHQFIDLYRKNLHLAPLHADAIYTLDFATHQIQQVILSAMEQEFLEETLKSKGILKYFDKVAGIRNHLGGRKT